MIAFDTYAWVEYFNGTAKGKKVARHVESTEEIVISAACIAELKVKYEREQVDAQPILQFVRLRSIITPVDETIALLAAEYRLKQGLYIMDALMYATARHHQTTLVTGDKHFENLAHIEFLR
jgi:uncharacterized protein